jgi:hypothetical protein
MRRIGLCIGVLWAAALGAVALTAAEAGATPHGVGLIDHAGDGRVYPAQDLPFPEPTIVVVHPWASGVVPSYLITLDDVPLAVLSPGQYVVWRTAPRDLILGMKSRDGLHLIHALRADPGGAPIISARPAEVSTARHRPRVKHSSS